MPAASAPSSAGELEFAHVLLMDLAGWSLLPADEQARQLDLLFRLLRGCAEVRRGEEESRLLMLPTGDGAGLVFFGRPEAPAFCALDLARALREHPALRLRMGVHCGPVYRARDVNGQPTVAGPGINTAQRVMNAAEPGQALLSAAAAELLREGAAWRDRLSDQGEREVKHGVRLHLYRLALDADPGPEIEPAPVPAVRRVVLLYRRHAEPDSALLAFLEAGLRSLGHAVFIDRHLHVGVEWAREIERQIREADAVIPLLSAASVGSEMLAYEVHLAHEAAQLQGRPRLLPVRVDYEGPLPESLAVVLDRLQYALWRAEADGPALLSALQESLSAPGAPEAEAPASPPVPAAPGPEPAAVPGAATPLPLEAYGGAVPLGSAFYLERETDSLFHQAVGQHESLVLVKGARQMGKTSLLARGLQRARQAGARAVLTDFQKLNAADLETPDRFFRTLAEWVEDQLDLDVSPGETWNSSRSPSINFERYIRRQALEPFPQPLVWGLDEVDRLFTCDFAGDVFGLFRSWHNERSLNPDRPWSRLTLAIAYATEAHLFITDINQSPFNVGVRLELEDFTPAQAAELNRRHGGPLATELEEARFYRLLGGHPYLVRRGLYELASRKLALRDLEAAADRDEGVFGDHLRRLLVSVSRDPELCEALRSVLLERPGLSHSAFYRLRSAGVIRGDRPADARPRCRLYAAYLERHLLG